MKPRKLGKTKLLSERLADLLPGEKVVLVCGDRTYTITLTKGPRHGK